MSVTTTPMVELRIPNRPEFVGVARLAVSAIASRMDFGYDALDDIKVAVGEACTNAILHAASVGEIVICCQLEPQRLVVEVRDQGLGFDPALLDGDTSALLPERGLGLLLIRSLMDQVELRTGPGSGTSVRMVKNLPK